MILKNQQNILRTWTKIIYSAMLYPNYLPPDGFKWLDPPKFNLENMVITVPKIAF